MNKVFTPAGRRYAYNIIQLADILPESKFNEFTTYLDGYKDGLNANKTANVDNKDITSDIDAKEK